MEMLTDAYLGTFESRLPPAFFDHDRLVRKSDIDFNYLIEASAVYSSRIEGNTMDLNSCMTTKAISGTKPKEYEEIVDLKDAYDFARSHAFTEEHMLKVHAMLSRQFLSLGNQGRYREGKVGVFGPLGLVYMAVEFEQVAPEMRKLFMSLEKMASRKLSRAEAFYYSSMAHLNFAHIHPFMDGNGRAARLLEKWFLSSCVGESAWHIQSEKYYWDHRDEYYKNINLGVNYYELDYARCLPFLLMLPAALA